MSSYVKDRILFLLYESDLIEEEEKKKYFYLIRKMINADFIDNLDVVRMRFKMEKENKLNESKKLFFDRLLKEN